MGTGACGIDCGTCRLRLRGLCPGCGAGNGRLACRMLEAQLRIYNEQCPILKCARDHGLAYCLRDCRRFPCELFERGPSPFSGAFLHVQKEVRGMIRSPSLDLGEMAQWESEEIDPVYWERLRVVDPREVCRRSLAVYEPGEEVYRLELLGRPYRIYPFRRVVVPDEKRFRDPDRYPPTSFVEALILLYYLLEAREVPPAGRWVTEKEITGGESFFRGPHELARELILERFGRDPEGFLEAAKGLGGRRIDVGDAGVELPALPRVPLYYILWCEDEEFPARLTIAFDATVGEHLALDVIWGLAHLVAQRLTQGSVVVSHASAR